MRNCLTTHTIFWVPQSIRFSQWFCQSISFKNFLCNILLVDCILYGQQLMNCTLQRLFYNHWSMKIVMQKNFVLAKTRQMANQGKSIYLLKKYLHVDLLTEFQVVHFEHLSSACDLILKALTKLPIFQFFPIFQVTNLPSNNFMSSLLIKSEVPVQFICHKTFCFLGWIWFWWRPWSARTIGSKGAQHLTFLPLELVLALVMVLVLYWYCISINIISVSISLRFSFGIGIGICISISY